LQSLFTVVSLGTTTGFVSGKFSAWPSFLPVMIMLLGVVGGCAASTSGGIKMIRALLLRKQLRCEIERLLHPHAVVQLKFGDEVLSDRVIQSMWGFMGAFAFLFVIFILVLMMTGLDLETAYGSTVASLANVGATIGTAAGNFDGLTSAAKWTFTFGMIAGRLEIFTLLVLFVPAFWRD